MLSGKPSSSKEHPDYVPSIFDFPVSQGVMINSEKKVGRSNRAVQRKIYLLPDEPSSSPVADVINLQDMVGVLELWFNLTATFEEKLVPHTFMRVELSYELHIVNILSFL